MSGNGGEDRKDREFIRAVLSGMGIGQRSAVKHIRSELERLWHIEDSLQEPEDDDE